MSKLATSIILFLTLLLFSQNTFGHDIKEESGITRVGSDLLIVGDEESGAYYRYMFSGDEESKIALIYIIRKNLSII
jgi:hypothetical protein